MGRWLRARTRRAERAWSAAASARAGGPPTEALTAGKRLPADQPGDEQQPEISVVVKSALRAGADRAFLLLYCDVLRGCESGLRTGAPRDAYLDFG